MDYDECMRRLRAVEPLPVGERLARKTANPYVLVRPLWCRLWNRAHYIPNPSFGSDKVASFYRPLRIARERAQAERRVLVLIRHALTVLTAAETAWRTAANDLAAENARLRATIRSRCSNDPADFEESYRAETFRLRAALEEALSLVGHFCFCQCRTCEEAKDRIRAIAAGTVKP